MRKAINENRTVQLLIVGGLVIGFGLLMVMRMGGKDEGAAAPPPDASAVSSVTPGAPTSTGSPVDSASLGAGTPAPSSSGLASPTAAPGEFEPGPGLPAPVVSAWKSGDAVVLLIVRGGGIDDRLVRQSVHRLSGDAEITTFVARAKDVADYSRVTAGVGVNRVPALVVIRPKGVSAGAPEAQVSYGFRNSDGVVQAVNDAIYTGRDNIPYYPD